MDILIFGFLFAGVFALCILGYWLDKKYNMQIVKWMNMEASSPFKETNQPSSCDYQQLQKRIENLEKIVTDSRWELDQKIKSL